MATLFVDKVDPQSGTSLEIGSSGDTISVPSGATINLSNATQTGVGGTNTPAFSAKLSGNFTLTQNTLVLIPFATEQWDTNNAYDNTASNYKFTVPSGEAGKYYVTAVTSISNQPSGTWNYTALYKNGASFNEPLSFTFGYTSVTQDSFAKLVGVLDLSVGDYLQIYATTNEASNKTLSSARCVFQMHKIIE